LLAIDEDFNTLWSEPLTITGYILSIFGDDDNIYLFAETDDIVELSIYDYEKNLISTTQLFQNHYFRVLDLGNAFMAITTGDDDNIEYMIVDKNGEILVNADENVFSNLNGYQHIENYFVKDGYVYALFSVSFGHENEYYENNFYLQKIDISDYVDTNDNIIPVTEFTVNAYPNPFNPNLTISYSLPADSDVSIDIYNLKGQKVTSLLNERIKAGEHQLVWNGKDNRDRSVGSGVYFYKVKAGSLENTNKIILMK